MGYDIHRVLKIYASIETCDTEAELLLYKEKDTHVHRTRLKSTREDEARVKTEPA